MKRKLLTVLFALVAALCLCFGLTACNFYKPSQDPTNDTQDDGGNGGVAHEHVFTAENECSICGEKWEYTKSDALEYTKVVLDGVEGYDVRFGEYKTSEFVYVGDRYETQYHDYGKAFEGEEVIFPYGYNGLPVISIGRTYPCTSDTVKSITVPKSIMSWGKGLGEYTSSAGAFSCSALEELNLPDGLTVYTRQLVVVGSPSAVYPLCLDTLFAGISAQKSEICPLYDDPQFRENGALYIGNYLFGTDFEEPVDNFTVKDGTKAIVELKGTKHVVLPDSVEVIGAAAFQRAELESIQVGNGIEDIGNDAFEWSKLTSITLPDKPIYIGSGAFDGTPFMENETNWEQLNEEDGYTVKFLYIGNHLISFRGGLISPYFEMKPELKSIAGGAFYSVMFDELRIPSLEAWFNVRRGTSSFELHANRLIVGGQAITEITIPEPIVEIPDFGFANIDSLTHITIHERVAKIGEFAFYQCSDLEKISVNADNPNYASQDGILYDKAKTKIICAPKRLKGAIAIPDSVTQIEDRAFYDCVDLTQVTVGSGITAIAYNAFFGCYKLVEVWNYSELDIQPHSDQNGSVAYYAEHVYTGNEAGMQTITDDGYIFYEDENESYLLEYTGNETELTLPATSPKGKPYAIYPYAFYFSDRITSVEIPDNVTKIGKRAFSISRLTNITIPEGVTSIESGAFSSSSLTTVRWNAINCVIDGNDSPFGNNVETFVFGENVRSIPDHVLSNCKLTSISIPDGVTEIGKNAFVECGHLESILVGANNSNYSSQYGILFNKKKTQMIYVPKEIKGAVTLPNGLKEIGERAFYSCGGLTSIVIPNSVISIGNGAFGYCHELMSIVIPNSVASIGNGVFEYCGSIVSIVIGSGLDEINAELFYTCDGLESITVNANNPNYSTQDGILYDKGKTQIIFVPQKYKGAVTIPDSVTAIPDFAYSSRAISGEIVLPDGVTSIGKWAFQGCEEITSITIGNNVKSIGEYAFGDCIGLAEIQFKGTVWEWQEIEKPYDWVFTIHFTITCTDGTIDENGNVTYFNN